MTKYFSLSSLIQTLLLGIILWEMLTSSVPFVEFRFDWQIAEAVVSGVTPPLPLSLPSLTSSVDVYIQLMKECWSLAPSDRPSFETLHERFVLLKEKCEGGE